MPFLVGPGHCSGFPTIILRIKLFPVYPLQITSKLFPAFQQTIPLIVNK